MKRVLYSYGWEVAPSQDAWEAGQRKRREKEEEEQARKAEKRKEAQAKRNAARRAKTQ